MNKKTNLLFLVLGMANMLLAQEKSAVKDTVQYAAPKQEAASNVLLNASVDDGPRSINVGLPLGTTGTVVSENGLLVSFDPQGQKPAQVWRSDGSFSKVSSLTLSQTAILYGDVCASVSTYTHRGTDSFNGNIGFTTNSFGLLRGNVTLSGPMKNGWYYALNGFINLDPSNYRSDVSRFLDKTYIFKGTLRKVYNGGKGEIGILYKYSGSRNAIDKNTPYIYRSDGSVDALPGLKIGSVAYTPRDRKVIVMNAFTGEKEQVDLLDATRSETHAVELFGKNKFDNGFNLDYIVRYNYANSGLYSPNFNDIISTDSYNSSDTRFIYAGNENEQVYTGYVQRAMGSIVPQSKKHALLSRIELSKKFDTHKLTIGFSGEYYRVDHFNRLTYSYLQEVANNPRQLIQQTWNADAGQWVNANDADEYGQWKYNGSLQYYNGHEGRVALYLLENWNITPRLNLEFGARIENHSFSGDWYSEAMRSAAPDRRWFSGDTEDVSRNFFNKSFSAALTWKVTRQWGFIAEASYFEKGGHLSAYSGADDPALKQSHTPYFSGGFYYNNSWISLITKVTRVQMSNIGVNGTFNNEETGESLKKTFNYDVQTLGWTTDVILRPFKGFNLHFLLTLQNPEYKKFEFDVFGKQYDYSGNSLRSISKTLIEIDPSYSVGKFKIWASARYFSKEAANYPNSVYFAARWETFAGLDYKYNKAVSFSLSAVNLLNQAGAQGSISGGNTITDGSKYYDKPLAGTYIRPFTVELKTKISF